MPRKSVLLLALLLACACGPKKAEEPAPDESAKTAAANQPVAAVRGALGRETIQAIELNATVKSVNQKERRITLVGPDKREGTFDVDPEVKRLKEIKAGDKVLVRYYQSLAIDVREPTPEELKTPGTVVEAAGKNTKNLPPGAAAARSIHAIVTVEAIDRNKQTVTVKGPLGRVYEVQLTSDNKLDTLKIGDKAAVTYTEALAIGIDPAS